MKRLIIFLILMVSAATVFAKTPIIGISGNIDGGRNVASTTYTTAVRNAGGVPIVLPMTDNDAQIDAYVNMIDGLIMTGGADFDPYLYGEEPIVQMETVEAPRDEFDIKLIRAAVAKGVPVFGICRGAQLTAVAFGGSLWQDIPYQTKSAVRHRPKGQARDIPVHSINIEKGSFLEKALGSQTFRVNSAHHQAVKVPSKGFKVVASSLDGLTEAVERVEPLDKKYKDGGAMIIGVQFHPEDFCYNPESPFVKIFKVLIEAASKK